MKSLLDKVKGSANVRSSLPILDPQGPDEEMMLGLQKETIEYFLFERNEKTGLVADSTAPHSPSSIAAVGMALCTYVVSAERGVTTRMEAMEKTLDILRFFHRSHQGREANSTGYRGFYYHFLDMKTGERAWQSELSTIDTAILCAGMLVSAEYFHREHEAEKEIRKIAHRLYERVDWQWACDGQATLTHGWKPESGFIPYRWDRGYNESLILYVLALGSPTFPISEAGYPQWTSTFQLSHAYGFDYLPAGPLFIHQMSQIWLNLRGLRDAFNRKCGFDYFENSRRATRVQQLYAIDNPKNFDHYGEHCWGLTASAGPGPKTMRVNGVRRTFYDYAARGAPDDLDDGTVSPWAVVSSLPFAPEAVVNSVRHAIERLHLKNKKRPYGFEASFNPTFPSRVHNPNGWVSPWKYGLNQGPIVMMIENYQSQLIWKLMHDCAYVTRGLIRAGFEAADPG
jgi:hypothetical protein